MTHIDEQIKLHIRKIVRQNVPDFEHPILHVNTRKQMVKVITQFIEKKQMNPTIFNITAMASNWNDVLHLRAKALN